MEEIRMFWYNPCKNKQNWKRFFTKSKSIQLNFGDELSAGIIKRLTQRPVRWVKENECNKLIGLGSVFHFAKLGDSIWGTGINGKLLDVTKKALTENSDLKIHAVRGPMTKDFLEEQGISCPSVFGDPGILTADLFPEFVRESKKEYIVIPHYSELELVKKLFPNETNFISPVNTAEFVINEITKAAFVISSSLHGIIVAESYGIPARLLKISNEEPLFKYNDYYQSTGRSNYEMAHSIDEALEMGGERVAKYNKKDLLKAFPLELAFDFTSLVD